MQNTEATTQSNRTMMMMIFTLKKCYDKPIIMNIKL